MTRKEQIKDWVAKYDLGYYFNAGGIEFFCPAFQDIKNCQVSDYLEEDDEDFEKLSNWIEQNKENFSRLKPKQYTYYSEGVIKHIL